MLSLTSESSLSLKGLLMSIGREAEGDLDASISPTVIVAASDALDLSASLAAASLAAAAA